MGITRFPHGIQAHPVIGGGARYDGWWGKTYFVDYDNGGAATADGLTPTSAFRHLQAAIDVATINDVIYIRNREEDITSTDPEYIVPESTTNWSVAEAKTHLSIIGASNVSHIPTQEGQIAVYLRGHGTANTTAVMDWRGAFGLIENLAFHRGASTSGGLLALTGNSTSLRALGTVVSNCLFRLVNHASHGGLHNVDNWFVTVYSCTFHDCRYGIYMQGSNSTIRRITIANCTFNNQTATSVDTNILMSGSNTQNVVIRDSYFTTAVPNYSGGGNKYINFTAAAIGLVANCYFFGTTGAAEYITDNGVDCVGCYDDSTNTTGLFAIT